ncbi:MAG: TraB/GumN family protein [Altererythrobacter sp.]|nr:TraB/GumN family protein [Altererythrobacter sp.]
MIRALLALLLCGLVAACGAREGNADPAPARPALWAIEDASGVEAGWLFGTIHALPAGTHWRTPAFDKAEARAGVLVVEVRDLDPGRMAAIFDRLARDRPGPPLAQRLPPQERRALAMLMEREDIAPDRLDGLETWAAALALARAGAQATPAGGVDKALIADFTGRPVIELEGAERQLAIFDRLPQTAQRALLVAIVEERTAREGGEAALARAWLAGDLAALDRETGRGLLADPGLRAALSTNRNGDWARSIAALLASGRRPLVAVGAAHMVGAEGLPALLAREGYKLRRLQ